VAGAAGAVGTSLPYGRQEYDLLSLRRQRAETRLSRERTRNGRLAFAGFVVLGVVLTVGMNGGYALLPGLGPPLAVPIEPGSFAATHRGSVLFSSFDGVICKQFDFDNETGRLANGKLVRCDEAEAANLGPADEPPPSPFGRTMSIRNAFPH
jgi:hypothetical protein